MSCVSRRAPSLQSSQHENNVDLALPGLRHWPLPGSLGIGDAVMAILKPSVVHLASPDEMEQQFYEALQQADIERLMAIWADDEEISCIHPAGPRLIGAQAIRSSFENMFSNGAIHAEAQHVRRVRTHSTAVHSVVERLRVMTEDGPQTAWVLATNVYIKTGLGWRLVAHHASPGSAREVQEIDVPASVLH